MSDAATFAIISFNVETLFHTVSELFQRREHYQLPIPIHSHPKYCFTRVSTPHPIPRDADSSEPKVCIHHCNGTLAPRLATQIIRPDFLTDELVFLEQDYLRVATQSATWPETLFMYHAKLSQMVFVGLSMSDQNIRRWLGLTEEFAARKRPAGSQRRIHYWITKRPDLILEPVLSEGLAHLGVRPAWLDSEISPLCRLILSCKPPRLFPQILATSPPSLSPAPPLRRRPVRRRICGRLR